MTNNRKSASTTFRPPLLSALCILTFIGSSIGFTGYFLASLYFEKATEMIFKYSSWHNVDAISPYYFTLLMALYAASLIGAIRMWKLHRSGFFIYAASQIALLFLPVIWINWNSFSTTNAVFILVFISGYLMMYKHLNRRTTG